jgi:hypothetical protein
MNFLLLVVSLFGIVTSQFINFNGTITKRVYEYKNGIDIYKYYLEDNSLIFNNDLPDWVITGTLINGTGNKQDNSIRVSDYQLTNSTIRDFIETNTTVNLKIAFFVLNICNYTSTQNINNYKPLILNQWNNAQSETLEGYYNSCSLQKVGVNKNDINIFGPIQIPCFGNRTYYNFTWNQCRDNEIEGWARYAEDHVRLLNISLINYKHRVFLIPITTSCNWLGLADVGCPVWCRSWLKGYSTGFSIQALFHELGHNHGLRHATGINGDEYGDFSSAMGGCCTIRCHNAPQGYSLGWYDEIGSTLDNKTLLSHETKQYNLPGMLSTYNNFIKIIPNWVTNNNIFYISYRQKIGYDINLESAGQVHINTFNGNRINRYFRTQLIKTLLPNTSWVEPISKFRIEYLSNNNETVSIAICRNITKCSLCGYCGDGICDPSNNENCETCPNDCNFGVTRWNNTFCCGKTHDCSYNRCNTWKFKCNYLCNLPSPPPVPPPPPPQVPPPVPPPSPPQVPPPVPPPSPPQVPPQPNKCDPSCGDGVCQVYAGENCHNCPDDCNQGTNRWRTWCCGMNNICDPMHKCNNRRYTCITSCE